MSDVYRRGMGLCKGFSPDVPFTDFLLKLRFSVLVFQILNTYPPLGCFVNSLLEKYLCVRCPNMYSV